MIPTRPKSEDTKEAIRHIGTNGIPTMLKMIQAKDSWLKTKWIMLARKQPFVKAHIIDATDKNFEGQDGTFRAGRCHIKWPCRL